MITDPTNVTENTSSVIYLIATSSIYFVLPLRKTNWGRFGGGTSDG